jgi:hypothetical protein
MFSGTAQVSHQVCQFFCQFYDSSCVCAIVVSAGKLRKLRDSLSELRSSLCVRRMERTVLRHGLLPVENCAVYSVLGSGMTSHIKFAQFNLEYTTLAYRGEGFGEFNSPPLSPEIPKF